MRPKKITVTGVANSPTIPVDYRANKFQLSFQCTINGTATYTVQHTLDDPFSGGTLNWLPNSTVVNLTTNSDGNYVLPIRAIRLSVTASTGSVDMTIINTASA